MAILTAGVAGVITVAIWPWDPAELPTPSYEDAPVERRRGRSDVTAVAAHRPICDHWLLPPVGAYAKYDVVGPGELVGTATIQLAWVREQGDEWSARWLVSIRPDGEPGLHLELDRRCHPERGAEDPWSGHMLSMPLMSTATRLWRWPRELDEGIEFGRRVSLTPDDSPGDDDGPGEPYLARDHVVEGLEELTVPGGRFRCWRVAIVEHAVAVGHEIDLRGLLWVAEGVGLVRAEYNWSSGEAQTWELVEVVRAGVGNEAAEVPLPE